MHEVSRDEQPETVVVPVQISIMHAFLNANDHREGVIMTEPVT